MKKIFFSITILLLIFITELHADGLMLSTNAKYPNSLLKNKTTEVTVNINGVVAETIVYQEFLNEWNDSTDAVYSFPLPPDARATKFLYWYNDKIYQAVLKVKEQAVNPGTGEGNIAALINKYVGRNGIKIALKGIKAGTIQRVELHYVSLCDYYNGKVTYNFPLNTGDFIKYPLDQIQFNFNVESSVAITGFEIPDFSGYKIIKQNDNNLSLKLSKPKSYENRDLTFQYQIPNEKMSADFNSTAGDSTDGYFALFVRPEDNAEADSVLPKRIIFLLSNSSTMFGYKLSQSIEAISNSIDKLSEKDRFNIVVFNSYSTNWKNEPVAANNANISEAKNYLANISASYGSNMQNGLEKCLEQIKDNSFNNTIVAFTDGNVYLDPRNIEQLNTHTTGIFPVGMGDDVNWMRLEMLARLNYGFTTYIESSDNIKAKLSIMLNKISSPVLKEVAYEYGSADVNRVIPEKIPSTYSGSMFFITGRYKNSGESGLSIAGTSAAGASYYNFRLNFSSNPDTNTFAKTLWAKEMIDKIEREIEIYGETPALKDSLINLSLAYNIRCRYTAYIADYATQPTAVDGLSNQQVMLPESYIAGNYPNPFNPTTKIRFYVESGTAGQYKVIRIYNLLGQLVALIDISNLKSGWNEVVFNGLNLNGSPLPSGVYIVQLQVGGKIKNSIKINLVK